MSSPSSPDAPALPPAAAPLLAPFEAWAMLVRLTAAVQGPEAARHTLRAGLDRVPDDPNLRQLAAELGR